MRVLLTLGLLGSPAQSIEQVPTPQAQVEGPQAQGEVPRVQGEPVPMVVPPPTSSLPDIRFRLDADLPVLVGFTALFGVTEAMKPVIAPKACDWCAPGPVARSVRAGLRWQDPKPAALTSDIVAYGVIPAFALTVTMVGVGTEGEWRKLHEDLIVALEAVAVSAALTNIVKYSTGRQRPYSLFADEPIGFADDPDQHLSFPSGHTALAFSIATSFATVATLRRRKLAPVLWGVGLPMAAFVGYLRMAGDRHWFGDVLAGAGLGTVVGVGLPWLLHHPRTGVMPRLEAKRGRASLTILPTGTGLSIAGRI
ncbi:phosphatase PAP2 family protein [Enhygromyxa salina]|uniref:PAP2 superfamily protein n=1 Tax=Enhygromyxa salina TaxID=215803 RepID=A0A2S9XLD1_9BACT|nr:phosphatase PAP2 family protein [Enhygromyxa salina]PRP93663.1 PAP2 superfamily protein [Enhygromyxa salina]